jgi:TrmH family RNA methyltransferase
MLSKNRIKYLTSLQVKKYREESNQFIAEGVKMVDELLNSSFKINEIFALNEWIEKNHSKTNILVTEIDQKELERISGLSTPNQVVALVDIPRRLINIHEIYSDLVIVLDEIRDPGNLGTIIRIADWYGIKNIVCSENSVDVYNPKVVQATMGSIARVDVFYTNLNSFISKTPKNINIYGTLLEGENIYLNDLSQNGIIVIGNEAKGISKDILPLITNKIHIPSFAINKNNKAESLNASIATAIICSEFRRRI